MQASTPGLPAALPSLGVPAPDSLVAAGSTEVRGEVGRAGEGGALREGRGHRRAPAACLHHHSRLGLATHAGRLHRAQRGTSAFFSR